MNPPDPYFRPMKRYSVLTLMVLLLLSQGSCKRKNTPLTEEEVVEVIHRFDEGWESKNINLVDSVLAPAYIYFTQSGGLFSRDSVVQTAGSPSYTLSRVRRSSFQVQLYGNVAIVSTRWEGVGSYRGRPFNEDQRCSITVIKKNGKVEILSEHCTPIQPLPIFH
ncbi:MAG: hypothetical protein RL732_852 [Bacteroidota bacterium]|jgi:hypothetical protein